MGQILGAVSGGLSLMQGKNAQSAQEDQANKALAQSKGLTDAQVAALKRLEPFLSSIQGGASSMVPGITADAKSAMQGAAQYDPHAETERAMNAYDAAANESVNRDLNSATVPMAQRGFTAGTGSSDRGAAVSDTLGRRAFQRGQIASSLTLGEGDRKRAVQGAASDRVGRDFQLLDPSTRATNVANSYGGPAAAAQQRGMYYSGLANSYDPSGAIQQINNGVQGIKFPWLRPNPLPGSTPLPPGVQGPVQR